MLSATTPWVMKRSVGSDGPSHCMRGAGSARFNVPRCPISRDFPTISESGLSSSQRARERVKALMQVEYGVVEKIGEEGTRVKN
jgi:hypothetical protein